MRKEWISIAVTLAIVAAFLLAAKPYLPPQGGMNIGMHTAAVGNTGKKPPSIMSDSLFRKVADNGKLRLEVNEAGQFAVTELDSGSRWTSNPDDAAMAGESAQGLWRQHLQSPFYLETVEPGKTKPEASNWSAAAARTTIEPMKDGVRVVHDLINLGIRLSYTLSLKGEYLAFDMPENGIEEYGARRVVTLRMFPFFGAVQSGSATGGIFVPEGMGAMIPIDASPKPLQPYSVRIYGEDVSVSEQQQRDVASNAPMPVYGMTEGNRSFVAIIERGAGLAKVTAYPAGLMTNFHWVGTDFILRELFFTQTSRSGQGFYQYEENLRREPLRIRYYFQNGDDAGYVGMAKAYRHYLMEKQGAQRIKRQAAVPMDLVFYGGATEKTFFGERTVAATTFDAASDILASLRAAGIPAFRVAYQGWSQGGVGGKLPSLNVSEALGGKAGLVRLARNVKAWNGELNLEVDWHMAGSSVRFLASGGFLRDLGGKTIERDTAAGKRYFQTVEAVRRTWENEGESLRTEGATGLQFNGLGRYLYAGYDGSERITRQSAAEAYRKLAEDVRRALGSVSVDYGNAYMIGRVDHIRGLPLGSTYDLTATRQVPFYPIAVHGLVTYSSGPYNLMNEPVRDLLQTVEYGAVPSFLITGEDPAVLKDAVEGGDLFSTSFDAWAATMVGVYGRTAEIAAETADRFITGHRMLSSDVSLTEYDNGTRVIVNYGDQEYRHDGVIVPPHDFRMAIKAGDGRG